MGVISLVDQNLFQMISHLVKNQFTHLFPKLDDNPVIYKPAHVSYCVLFDPFDSQWTVDHLTLILLQIKDLCQHLTRLSCR